MWEEAAIVSFISKLDAVILGEQASIVSVKEGKSPDSQKSNRSDIDLYVVTVFAGLVRASAVSRCQC